MLYFLSRRYNAISIPAKLPSPGRARVSAKGWVVIPAHLRRRYGIEPGHELQIVDYGGVLGLVPALADPVGESRGLLAGGPSLTEALVEERRREREREKG